VTTYTVDADACIGCGACSSLAPTLFAIEDQRSRVLRRPETDDEQRLVEAALLVCPTSAIRRRDHVDR
jgi:ferredoxin